MEIVFNKKDFVQIIKIVNHLKFAMLIFVLINVLLSFALQD